MNYTRMNLKEWSRGDLFQFYIDKMRIVMSLTVDVDVTNLKAYSKKHHLDFYLLMVWVVSKVVNAHDEFKYSWDADGNLIKWDFVSPSFIRMTKISPKWSRSMQRTFWNFTAEWKPIESDTKISAPF